MVSSEKLARTGSLQRIRVTNAAAPKIVSTIENAVMLLEPTVAAQFKPKDIQLETMVKFTICGAGGIESGGTSPISPRSITM